MRCDTEKNEMYLRLFGKKRRKRSFHYYHYVDSLRMYKLHVNAWPISAFSNGSSSQETRTKKNNIKCLAQRLSLFFVSSTCLYMGLSYQHQHQHHHQRPHASISLPFISFFSTSAHSHSSSLSHTLVFFHPQHLIFCSCKHTHTHPPNDITIINFQFVPLQIRTEK